MILTNLVCVVQAMGKNSFYLGEVGNASKMNLVLQVSIIIVKQCFGSKYIEFGSGSKFFEIFFLLTVPLN